jgi:hypothetical protein
MVNLAALGSLLEFGKHAPALLIGAVELLVFLLTAGLNLAYAYRCRIELLPCALLVNNGLYTRRVAPTEITTVSATIWGLKITRTGHLPLIAAAAPTPRHHLRTSRPTPAERIAATILHAAHTDRP